MGNTTKVSIDVLKVHPRNTEFFDDISGEDYQRFKESIKEDGILQEIIVSPDMTIISGHQRCKAAKEVGIKMVPVKIREDLDTEEKKLKVLLAANFGRIKNDDKKQRKVADEYVKLRGFKKGRPEKDANLAHLTLDEIAQELGISKRNLQRMLRIERDLTEEMKEFLDDGVISKTIASDLVATLSFEEQEELISSLDATKKITKSQMEKYINEIKRLKENPVTPADYESNKKTLVEYKKKLESYRKKVDELQEQIEEYTYSAADEQEKLDKLESMYMERINDLEFEKKQLEEQRKLDQEDVFQFNQLKRQIDYLTKQKTDLGRQISSATELSELTVKMQEILEKELAPIKFKRCMEELRYSDIAYDNLVDILDRVETWCEEIRDIIEEERKFDTPQARTHKLFEDFANSDPFELLRQYHNKEGVYAEQEKPIEREYLTPAQMEEKFNREHGIIDVSTLYGDDDEE